MSDALPIPKQSTPSSLRCRHIGPEDRSCGSPAMRGESFCYHHHQARRPVENLRHRRARQSIFSLPAPDSRSDIQQALGTIMVRIAANDIDLRRAGLLLYALQIANSNLNHHQSQKARSQSSHSEQNAAEPTASSTTKTKPETTQSPFTSDTSSPKCHPEQSPFTSDASHQKCHPERSGAAAQSKDLRLDLSPQLIAENQTQSAEPGIHYGTGPIPDCTHPQTAMPNPNHDFTPPPPVWRSISKATGAALLDVLARSEGAEPLQESLEVQESPEDRLMIMSMTPEATHDEESNNFLLASASSGPACLNDGLA